MSSSALASPAPAAAPSGGSGGGKKKLHGRAFYESIGSPKHIVAPMVDQSEFAWRMLIRSFLPPDQRATVLAYSPMLHARLFVDNARYRETHFEPIRGGIDSALDKPGDGAPHLDGNPALDRPLFVQFCANDPDTLLAAARRVAPYCDAVDLNLGCPQGIARKGHYGAFLQEDPALVARLVRTLHEGLDGVPVTAKIRLLDSPEASLRYARTVLDAGASILTIHGRQRSQKGHLTGLADWAALRYLRTHLPPDAVLFANGNVLQPGDVARCLAATGFDGVMSAEGLLSDPGLFAPVPPVLSAPPVETKGDAPQAAAAPDAAYFWPTPDPQREYWTGRRRKAPRTVVGGWRVDAIVRRYLDLLHVYVDGAVAPPARRPLFVVGDPVDFLTEGDDAKELDPAAAAAAAAAGGAGGAGADGGAGLHKRKRDAAPTPQTQQEKDRLASPNLVGVQAHLFHVLRHAVARHHDIRDAVARSRKGDLAAYERILGVLERRVARALVADEPWEEEEGEEAAEDETAEDEAADADDAEEPVVDDPNSSVRARRRCRRPWWVAQPILRPMPAEALAKGAIQLKKKTKAELRAQARAASEAAPAEAAPAEAA